MGETDLSNKEAILSVVFIIFGVLILVVNLARGEITRITLHMTGVAFIFWAFAASPKIMFQKTFEKGSTHYSNTSKILFLVGCLFFALSLFVHFYYKR